MQQFPQRDTGPAARYWSRSAMQAESTPVRWMIPILVALLHLPLSQRALEEAPGTQPSTKPAQQIVSLTEKAAKEIKVVAAAQDFPKYYLRVGVKAEGDGKQFRYILDITDQRPDPEADKVFDSHGVSIAIDHKSAIYLMGTVIDFSDGDAGKGFVFRNPNALEK